MWPLQNEALGLGRSMGLWSSLIESFLIDRLGPSVELPSFPLAPEVPSTELLGYALEDPNANYT